jgi:uncharacterized protein YbbC (DUF1343 family)
MVFVAGCAGMLSGGATPAAPTVLPGIDVLLRDSSHLVQRRGVGLVTNQGGIDAAGKSDVDRLLGSGVHLVALFSPEHGFRGTAEPGETIATTRDSATGLPIYSLYGSQRGPTDSMLGGVDVLLVDLPDVGSRSYTYLSTTIEVMRPAARFGKPVVILDRPNPIGGAVQGNVLNPAYRSFVGPLAMPMRHGMTLGELARLANRELSLGANLQVVPSAGWTRTMTILDTRLPFVAPSPNLKDPESLFHYPGTVHFEGTALSVGRGTDAPFRQIGSPWLDTRRVKALFDAERLPGVRLEEVSFTPVSPGDAKFPGVALRGLRLVMTDPARYDALHAAVALLVAVQRVHPDSIGFRNAGFDRLSGGPGLREAVQSGRSAASIVDGWKAELEEWIRYRDPELLYH